MCKDVSKDGTTYTVPCAADGARYSRHGIGSHEEGHGEVGAESCVLHAHLDAEGALFCYGEVAEGAYGVSEDIAYSVVAEDHTEGKQEEEESVLDEWGVDGCDDSTYDAGKCGYGYSRHAGLYLTKHGFVSQPSVKQEADGYGDDGDDEYLAEHADGINIDTFSC